MVRPAHVGRSRGCQPCRTRRIKCDLTQPKCQRCLESGRDCPGPLTGVLVIQAEQTASGKMRGKLLPSSSRPSQRTAAASQPDLFALTRLPSQPELAEDNLLSRFLEFFSRAARRSSWTLKLPQLKNNPDAHALRSSLRAVSLAYFAHVMQDRAAQFESLRHYGQSLARQRTALTQLPSFYGHGFRGGGADSISVDAATNALLATVILSYFELISPSGFVRQIPSSTAWVNHTLAAERLITMLGPQSLSNDIIGQLFFSIRSHAVHRAAVLGHYTPFSEKEWLEAAVRHVPKQSYARSAYDRVTEWILRLSTLKLTRDGGNNIGINRIVEDETDSAESLLKELNRRYAAFLRCCRQVTTEEVPLFVTRPSNSSYSQSTASLPPGEQLMSNRQRSTDGLVRNEDVLLQQDPSRVYCLTTGVLAEGPADLSYLHPKLQKLFAAMTTAYFHAAAILLQSYFPEVTSQRSTSLQIEEWVHLESASAETLAIESAIQDLDDGVTAPRGDVSTSSDGGWDTLYNARVILAAGRYLSPEGKSNGTAVLRMVLPFSVIWHLLGDDAATVGNQGASEGSTRRDGGRVNESQRVRLEARSLFADWCRREGMGGVIAVGFGDVN